jgi:cytochrome c peroxidase
LYTLKNIATGEIVEISDPGAALQTGKWKDIGRVKVPSLRAMASRAPYFHNGSAKELNDVVRFYDKRFAIGFTAQEMLDLTAFLSAL